MSTELENVVVIGAATAGINVVLTLAKTLPASHRIVLIEANPVAYWSIGALRASVSPGFEDKTVHDLNTKTIFGNGDTRHVVLPGTRVVDVQPDYVVVDRDVTGELTGSQTLEGGKTKLKVNKVVLAVGSDYGFPMRVSSDAKTKQDVLQGFRKVQKEVEAAQEILVVGGGPTGVEFVGEVTDQHPNKVVTLITRGPSLVSNGKDELVGMGRKLLSQLEQKGVRVILNDSLDVDDLTTGALGKLETFTTKEGKTLTADFVMLGSGGKPHTSWLDPSLLDSNSLIKVKPTFQVDHPSWANYYALGDAANTPGPKTSQMAGKHAVPCAQNVISSIKGQGEEKMKKASPPPANLFVVPLGKSGGASYLAVGTLGGWVTGLIKGRDLFVGMFEGWFKA